jgi:hypothetical protein
VTARLPKGARAVGRTALAANAGIATSRRDPRGRYRWRCASCDLELTNATPAPRHRTYSLRLRRRLSEPGVISVSCVLRLFGSASEHAGAHSPRSLSHRRCHRLERVLGVATDLFADVLGKRVDRPRSSSSFHGRHGLFPVDAGRPRYRHAPPLCRTPRVFPESTEDKRRVGGLDAENPLLVDGPGSRPSGPFFRCRTPRKPSRFPSPSGPDVSTKRTNQDRLDIPDHEPHHRPKADEERRRQEQPANSHRLIGPDLSFPIVVIDLPHTSTDPRLGEGVTTSRSDGPA